MQVFNTSFAKKGCPIEFFVSIRKEESNTNRYITFYCYLCIIYCVFIIISARYAGEQTQVTFDIDKKKQNSLEF